MKAIIALALSASLGTAMAAPAPIVFGDHSNFDITGGEGTAFNDVYTSLLTLTSRTWATGALNTNDIGSAPLIDVQSVVLRQVVGGSAVIAWTPGLSIDWDTVESGTETWSLPSTWLDAGTWQLEVTGTSYMDKGVGGYDGAISVPEPMSLSLALGALGLLALSRRRA